METITVTATDFLKSLTISTPSVVLFGILLFAVYVAFKAQKRDDFDFADMLRDETGKPSALRTSIFVSLAITSWVLVYIVIEKRVSDSTLFNLFAIYIAVWSGAKVAEKAIDAWAARGGASTHPYTPAGRNSQPPQ
jgi:archaellum biogenesis protein FlaJ (TadC family)